VTSITGTVVARQLYGPYGAPRWSSGALPTDYRYTGQRPEETRLGSLYDYGARFYSVYLNRWLQPDTIVPQPGNPQSLNRYSYVLNSPLKYTDPTGHHEECSYADGCGQAGTWTSQPEIDFLSSLPPIPTSTEINLYDLTGATTRAVGRASKLFDVPPEFVAAVLNYENHRQAGLAGAIRRTAKMGINGLLGQIDKFHDEGVGYSMGVGNVKPGTAQTIEQYFMGNYSSDTEQYRVMSALHKLDTGKLNNGPMNVLYVAGNVRIAIDLLYEQGYRGPISQDNAALVISYHNSPSALLWGRPGPAGIEGITLLIQASLRQVPLPFFPGR